jgi:hypothetical protein
MSKLTEIKKDKTNRLEYLTKQCGAYNDFGVRPISEWPDISDKFNLKQLKEEADRLPVNMELDFLDGEFDDVNRIKNTHNLHQLNSFLNEVFDGCYHCSIGVC